MISSKALDAITADYNGYNIIDSTKGISTKMDKKRALNSALLKIEKQFGKGAVMWLGGEVQAVSNVISTGCLSIDLALGVGGMPRGRVVEIYGPESSGKTTVALSVVAEAQKNGGYAAFIDAEHALDPAYASNIGVNLDELLVSQPDTGEQALEIVEAMVRTRVIDVVIIDSVAALAPRAEITGEMGASHVGLQARLMSQALRKLSGVISKSNTAVIFINQIREKVGIIFGSPEVTPGGRALKFYSSIRLEVKQIEDIKKGSDFVGNRTRAKVVKNKVAPPFKEAVFDIIYGKGISKEGVLLDLALAKGLVVKSGTWYSYREERLGQGYDNSREYILNNTNLYFHMEKEVKEAYGLFPKSIEGFAE